MTGRPTPATLIALREGVDLEDGPARARSVRVVETRGELAHLRLVMTEGRKREVRRMLAAVDLPVRRLVRLRMGPITLGRTPPGEVRELTAEEVVDLTRAADRAARRRGR